MILGGKTMKLFNHKNKSKSSSTMAASRALLSEYEIERSEAALHVKAVLDKLNEAGVIQE